MNENKFFKFLHLADFRKKEENYQLRLLTWDYIGHIRGELLRLTGFEAALTRRWVGLEPDSGLRKKRRKWLTAASEFCKRLKPGSRELGDC
ncbi:MAG: hypothetical protein ACK5YY_06430 [Alphaproteobacteria bacterium]|jgi:hypothetical protein